MHCNRIGCGWEQDKALFRLGSSQTTRPSTSAARGQFVNSPITITHATDQCAVHACTCTTSLKIVSRHLLVTYLHRVNVSSQQSAHGCRKSGTCPVPPFTERSETCTGALHPPNFPLVVHLEELCQCRAAGTRRGTSVSCDMCLRGYWRCTLPGG